MLFNSFEFALFLPVVFLLYWFVFNRSLRAQNLFVVTGYSGYDPEVSQSESATQMGIDWGTYPNVRTVVVGLNLTF